MITELQTAKRVWRTRLSAIVADLTPKAKRTAADAICRQALDLPPWQQAATLLLFSPRPDEPDIRPLLTAALAAAKKVALPAFDPARRIYLARQIPDRLDDLVPGHFRILEPPPAAPVIPWNRLDFVLVPGVGFSRDGHRLGRGKGHYDRFLALVPGWKCGVAFDEQVVDTLPFEPHDIRLDCILTPSSRLP